MKEKGERRIVTNPVTGQTAESAWPLTREEAIEEGLVFYWPWGTKTCDVSLHRGQTWKVFVVTNLPVCCAPDLAYAAWKAAGAAGEPMNPGEAAAMGLDYYWKAQHGSHCGHAGKVTMAGKCWECQQAVINGPRQTAVKEGETWYTPVEGDLCPAGHSARRRVVNGSCEECERIARARRVDGRSDEMSIHKILPDHIITKAQAIEGGFKVYRTGEPCRAGHRGWRYVSTGNCLTCMGR